MRIVAQIVTRHGRLPIGAPSSPVISNALLYPVDVKLSQIASEFDCRYSRYADDVVFSTNIPNVLTIVLAKTREVLAQGPLRLIINEDKVAFTSRKRRVKITGLTLSTQGEVSLGRKSKRTIKSLVHRALNTEISDSERSYLAGYIAYVKAVEPRFITSLEKKYGSEAMDSIYLIKPIRRKALSDRELRLARLQALRVELRQPENDRQSLLARLRALMDRTREGE